MQIISFSSSSSSAHSFTSSSTSSSSSAHSSGGHCHRAKKHHRPRHHPCHSPPPLHHRRHHFVEDYHHTSPAPPHCSRHHRHEHGKLRVKPPKPSTKIRKLHHKLMKACKLPKGARHGRPRNHMHCFSPEERFLCTHIGDQYFPSCCLHNVEDGRFSSEEWCRFHEIGESHDHPGRHAHPHPPGPHRLHQTSACIKSEVMGGAEALVSPIGVEELLAEPPVEDGGMPAASG